MKTEIYIATHKKTALPSIEGYIPIQVGASFNDTFLDINDSIKDNIGEKNKNYCELTALYWVWKNSDACIKGITHYRRYFFKNSFANFSNILSIKSIRDILDDYDIIVPRITRTVMHKNTEEVYLKWHHKIDWDNTREVIKELEPEYLQAFDLMAKSKNLFRFNMFIANNIVFDDYVSWLLKILFEVEKISNIENYDSFNKRIFGFLSERLLYVYIIKNKMNYYECPVFNIEENIVKQDMIAKAESILDKVDGLFNKEKRSINKLIKS